MPFTCFQHIKFPLPLYAVRIKCRDLVKKIAIYKSRLAVSRLFLLFVPQKHYVLVFVLLLRCNFKKGLLSMSFMVLRAVTCNTEYETKFSRGLIVLFWLCVPIMWCFARFAVESVQL